ncbi:SDR family NAD(P)-dependent oxidoreductase [Streptomyces sp. NPDC026673]|uniref:SDR family NAD(P)-dependent oxidoreductase n=1 Tax=Streptomyces sp. NPDC026673 TaxID=3155724 RepID=UPI0033E2349B
MWVPGTACRTSEVCKGLSWFSCVPIHVAHAALSYVRARGGGRIVQVFTHGGHAACAGGFLCSAGTFGIEGFMEALAEEVAPFGIGVTIVEPGTAGR